MYMTVFTRPKTKQKATLACLGDNITSGTIRDGNEMAAHICEIHRSQKALQKDKWDTYVPVDSKGLCKN
jgi:hypothetical protein